MSLAKLPKTWSRSLLSAVSLALPGMQAPLSAQVGLTSGVAQVALVAHAEPRGSIQGIGSEQETARAAGVRQVAVNVRLSVNTGYQLLVRANGLRGHRVFVQAADGTFQQLMAGSSVVVARGRYGQWERTVQYRVEMPDAVEVAEPLPVVYELAINPSI